MSKKWMNVDIMTQNGTLKTGYISLDDITMFRKSNIDCNHTVVVIGDKEYFIYKEFNELKREILGNDISVG